MKTICALHVQLASSSSFIIINLDYKSVIIYLNVKLKKIIYKFYYIMSIIDRTCGHKNKI